jgi:hypothetical protein
MKGIIRIIHEREITGIMPARDLHVSIPEMHVLLRPTPSFHQLVPVPPSAPRVTYCQSYQTPSPGRYDHCGKSGRNKKRVTGDPGASSRTHLAILGSGGCFQGPTQICASPLLRQRGRAFCLMGGRTSSPSKLKLVLL